MDETAEGLQNVISGEWDYDPRLEEWSYFFSDGGSGNWRITCSPECWSMAEGLWSARISEVTEDGDDLFGGKSIPLSFPRHYVGNEVKSSRAPAFRGRQHFSPMQDYQLIPYLCR